MKLAGAPSALRSSAAIAADGDDLPTPAAARLDLARVDLARIDLARVDLKSASGVSIATRSANMVGGKLRMRLEPATPSGSYAGTIDLGGIAQAIEVDVVDTIAVQLTPAALMIDLSSGREQTVAAVIENRGNVALTIDLSGDYPLGEELPLLRDIAGDTGGDGLQRLADVFARAGNPQAGRSLREAGQVTLSMPDGPFRLEPADARILSLGVAFPPGLTPTARYRAYVPVFGRDLELVAVTAAKPAPPRQRGA